MKFILILIFLPLLLLKRTNDGDDKFHPCKLIKVLTTKIMIIDAWINFKN